MSAQTHASELKLLIVEDEQGIVDNLYAYFQPLGYELDSARDGLTGLALAAERAHDAIVLDLKLPALDGIELCRRLREQLRDTPVIMLTARDTVEDRILGLRAGADDYLIKPFSLMELEARIKALVRRSRRHLSDVTMRLGPLEIDPRAHEARRDGQRLDLSPTGYRIVLALLKASPGIVTRASLERALWGSEQPASESLLRTHIHAVRNVIDKPFRRPMLLNVPGIGYRLVDPDEP